MKKIWTKRLMAVMTAVCLIFLSAGCAQSKPEKTVEPAKEPAAEEQNDSGGGEEESQESGSTEAEKETDGPHAKLLYMGHASIRIVTPEGKVIYIDPFAGEGYEPAADLILVTHSHSDHSAVEKVANRNSDCRIITWEEALEGGEHKTFDLDYVKVEAVEAGYNKNHDVSKCVGYILTLSDGVSVYVTGDTSTTKQMPQLAERDIDYAFFCCDGVYNMDMAEAAGCAKTVGARHNIPYHMLPANEGNFDRQRAEQFDAPNRLIIEEGEEIDLTAEE